MERECTFLWRVKIWNGDAIDHWWGWVGRERASLKRVNMCACSFSLVRAPCTLSGVLVLCCCSCVGSCIMRMPSKGAGLCWQTVRATGQVLCCLGILLVYMLRCTRATCSWCSRKCCGSGVAGSDERASKSNERRRRAQEKKMLRRLRKAQDDMPRELHRAASNAVRRGSDGLQRAVQRVRGSSADTPVHAKMEEKPINKRRKLGEAGSDDDVLKLVSFQPRFRDLLPVRTSSRHVHPCAQLAQHAQALTEHREVFLHLDAATAGKHQVRDSARGASCSSCAHVLTCSCRSEPAASVAEYAFLMKVYRSCFALWQQKTTVCVVGLGTDQHTDLHHPFVPHAALPSATGAAESYSKCSPSSVACCSKGPLRGLQSATLC